MANNINRHLSHIKSSQTQTVTEYGLEVTKPKLPLASQIMDGEIAINFADGHETISIHNNASPSEVVSFLNENVIYENEEITAAALVDLDGRLLVCEEQGESFANMVSITYSELKTLRNEASLVPGTWYRITDYVTTTAQSDTQSANHPFDVVVLATDTDALSENAKAIQNEDDSYFDNAKLDGWVIKYYLDNDDSRFTWADTTNGKGVIYYMKDEWNNECPYDFKNIQFKRWAITDVTSTKLPADALNSLKETFVYNNSTQPIRYSHKGDGNVIVSGTTLTVNTGETGDFYYTFTWIDENNQVQDASIVGQTLPNDEGLYSGVYGNCIKSAGEYNTIYGGNSSFRFILSSNVFVSSHAYEDGYFYGIYGNNLGEDCFDNTFGNNCYSNTFGDNCFDNTFGNWCYNNSYGNYCYNNLFGNRCYQNSFGNNCLGNLFGTECYRNSSGNNCEGNSFGDSCEGNSFGNQCGHNNLRGSCNDNKFDNRCENNVLSIGSGSNVFGNDCHHNTLYSEPDLDNVEIANSHNVFGVGCNYISIAGYFAGMSVDNNTFGAANHHITLGPGTKGNTLGSECNNISFGVGSSYNTFGNKCANISGLGYGYNSFGNECTNISLQSVEEHNVFGNNCEHITFDKSHMRYIEVKSGNRYITITSPSSPEDQPSSEAPLQNIIIMPGVNNSNNTKVIECVDVDGLPLIGKEYSTTYQSVLSTTVDI